MPQMVYTESWEFFQEVIGGVEFAVCADGLVEMLL